MVTRTSTDDVTHEHTACPPINSHRARGCYVDSRTPELRGCYINSRQSRPRASTSMWLWTTFGSKGDLRRPSVR